eukprot:TRINITY_DN23566_c0_g1_i1.p1 TRINITY_DN23566_c0_g1~~TRINITY_DN23566_c0_g1_i1.p1  ORF type:complete len:362 (-),score=96.32 TRINITY_DN23566_c0_g1_i1:80-1069(-)
MEAHARWRLDQAKKQSCALETELRQCALEAEAAKSELAAVEAAAEAASSLASGSPCRSPGSVQGYFGAAASATGSASASAACTPTSWKATASAPSLSRRRGGSAASAGASPPSRELPTEAVALAASAAACASPPDEATAAAALASEVRALRHELSESKIDGERLVVELARACSEQEAARQGEQNLAARLREEGRTVEQLRHDVAERDLALLTCARGWEEEAALARRGLVAAWRQTERQAAEYAEGLCEVKAQLDSVARQKCSEAAAAGAGSCRGRFPAFFPLPPPLPGAPAADAVSDGAVEGADTDRNGEASSYRIPALPMTNGFFGPE